MIVERMIIMAIGRRPICIDDTPDLSYITPQLICSQLKKFDILIC